MFYGDIKIFIFIFILYNVLLMFIEDNANMTCGCQPRCHALTVNYYAMQKLGLVLHSTNTTVKCSKMTDTEKNIEIQ